MAEQQRPIIIIKRKKGHGGGHHGGAWKVAYADFVTAMMALFIVLWLMNSSKQLQEVIGGYFKDPTGTSKKVGTNQNGAADNFVITKDNMKLLKEQLQKKITQNINLDKLKDQIEMTITADGLRIELLETDKGTFFDSGSEQPTPKGKELLTLLARELGQIPNKISVEGHTDSKPFARDTNYGNWELSAGRGNTARRIMQANGIHVDQISQVRGYADQRLRKPANPLDPSNRRISLIVQYLVKNFDDDDAPVKPGADAGSKHEKEPPPKQEASAAAHESEKH
jgi:chemotaxis protein MotB